MRYSSRNLRVLGANQCLLFALFVFLAVSMLAIASVLFYKIYADSPECTTNVHCQDTIPSACLESVCDLATETCQIIIPGSGECWSDSQCGTGRCDLSVCECASRCSGVTCTSDNPCEILQCDEFTGNCTLAGYEPDCCSNETACPTINECLVSSCNGATNKCEYSSVDGSECIFDTDCPVPGASCVNCQCSIQELVCDLEEQTILYDKIKTLPTLDPYFFSCGFSTAISGNLSATLCNGYTSGLGGKLQIRVNDGRQWLDTASLNYIGSNQVNSRVALVGNYVLVGTPFAFDPVSGSMIGVAAVYEYDHVSESLTLLRYFSFNDDPTFYPLRLGYGFAVSISDEFVAIDGVIASVLGSFTSIVVIYRMTAPGVWTYQQTMITPFLPILSGSLIQSVDVKGDILVYGILNSVNNSAIVVNQFNETTGLFEHLFDYPENGNSGGVNYGFRVATDGDTIIGSTQPNVAMNLPPSVFVFNKNGTLIQEIRLPEYSTTVSNGFASSLDILGDKIVIGCSTCNGLTATSGAFYLYMRGESQSVYDFFRKGYPFDNPSLSANLFGNSISLSERYIAVGSPDYDPTGLVASEPGAIYVVECT